MAAAVLLVGIAGAALAGIVLARTQPSSARSQRSAAALRVASTVERAGQGVLDLLTAERAAVTAVPAPSPAAFAGWSVRLGAFARLPGLVELSETVLDRSTGAAGSCRRPLVVTRTTAELPPPGLDACTGLLGLAARAAATSGRAAFGLLRIAGRTRLEVELPFYRGARLPATPAARRRDLLGWVGAGLTPQATLRRALAGQPAASAVLADRADPLVGSFAAGRAPPAGTTVAIALGDGWQLEVAEPAPPATVLGSPAALTVLLGGIAASLLVALLVFALATARAEAREAARRHTDELHHLALVDDATGLPRRALVMDRVAQLLVRTRRSLTSPALFLVDLGRLDQVAAELGTTSADELLQTVAGRLSAAVREGDTVGHLGRGELVVVAECSLADEGADAILGRIRATLSRPLDLPGQPRPVRLRARIGMAVGDRALPEQLLHDADLALSQAKATAAGSIGFVRRPDDLGGAGRRQLGEELANALAQSELFLVYTPVVDLQRTRLVGLDARPRWRHPAGGIVAEDALRAHLDATAMTGPVGAWVLREACAQAARWAALGHPLDVAVDLSHHQLDDDLVDTVAAALSRSGLAQRHLLLDLPESALLEAPNATSALLRRLRSLGVRIALDQFGTGYTSLAYLRQFTFDLLKIDATVVAGAARSEEAAALLRRLVHLGRRLDLPMLATGLDADEARVVALEEGVELGQGRCFGEPFEAAAFPEALRHLLDPDSGRPGPAVAGPHR